MSVGRGSVSMSLKDSIGELQVTIVAGRNLRSDGKAEIAYCTIDLHGNKTARTSSSKNKEAVWNESFNFDLMALDDDEVLIQVFGKRRIATDKFLGQIQLPIKGLNLSKDISWHYLTDKPKNPHELPDHMRVDAQRVKSPQMRDEKRKSKEDKEEKTYVTGEISVRLNFTHRILLRDKSKRDLLEADGASLSASTLSMPASPASPPISPRLDISGSLELNRRTDGERDAAVPNLVLAASPPSSPSTPPLYSNGRRESEKQVSFPVVVLTPRERSSTNADEAKAIETAFMEKLQLVKEKLKDKRALISQLTTNVNLLKAREDQTQFTVETQKLNEMQKELTELEQLEKECMESLDGTNKSATTQVKSIDRTKSRAQFDRRERRLTGRLEVLDANKRASKRYDSIPKIDMAAENFVDETKYLRHRVAVLETELQHERKISDVINSKNMMLEKDNQRLEDELQKLQAAFTIHDQGALQLRGEGERLTRDTVASDGSVYDQPTDNLLAAAVSDGTAAAMAAIAKISQEVQSISKNGKEQLEVQRREIEQDLRGVELGIERHMMMQKRVEVDAMSRKLTKKKELLALLDLKHKKKETASSEGDYSDDYDDASEDDKLPSGHTDAKLDMLVVKLEKLDKLDELLKKIDNMKYASVSYGGGDQGGGEQTRSYDDIKKELEEFQKIIVDENGKYTEKQKDEANIKYEKVFTELSQTKQYKAEIAQQLEEKRRANEPLNKAALEKMLKVYSAENLRNDPNLRDKVLKNQELCFIGLDPKAILAKHQNDFSQYLLRLVDIDELRAVRASLPKFRPDQKRQLEWVGTLEAKIENVAKAVSLPPKPPKPTNPNAKSWKPKVPPKNATAPPTDMFAELLAKRKKTGEEQDAVSSPRNDEDHPDSNDTGKTASNTGTVRGKLKLAPTKQSERLSSSSGTTIPMPPREGMTAPPPPPPPPPPMSF